MENFSANAREKYHAHVKRTFEHIFELVGISDWEQPLVIDIEQMKSDVCITNPYSKISCILFYLYSLELGTPPFYSVVNQVARDKDESQVQNLGPFIRALTQLITEGESEKAQLDRIKMGNEFKKDKCVAWNMAGAFLLWKGANMKQEWIQRYEQMTSEAMHIDQNIVCYRDPKMALNFVLNKETAGYVPVLFVIACQNYIIPYGVYINSGAFTAYPAEDAFILHQSCKMYVLDVEPDVGIHNSHYTMQSFDGKTITIIHLLHIFNETSS